MSKAFDEYISDKPEINIISKEDLSLLKIKLGKSHRKESDWAAIKDMLNNSKYPKTSTRNQVCQRCFV